MGMIVVTEELSRGSLAAAGSLITRPEILSRALLAGDGSPETILVAETGYGPAGVPLPSPNRTTVRMCGYETQG